jgi:hypothetical protein
MMASNEHVKVVLLIGVRDGRPGAPIGPGVGVGLGVGAGVGVGVGPGIGVGIGVGAGVGFGVGVDGIRASTKSTRVLVDTVTCLVVVW